MAFIRILTAVAASFIGILMIVCPALAQFGGAAEPDLSGSWRSPLQEDAGPRTRGPLPADYSGLPLNDAGKALALSTSIARYSAIDRQCAMYPPQYLVLGPFGMKVWADLDPSTGSTIAYHIGAWEDRTEAVIWMDGRPHPSANAPHTRAGFETGQWRGNTLTTHTSHIKMGMIRRNGAQVSDETTLTSHYIRNGNLLTVLVFVEDPVYLSEPLPVSKDFQLNDARTVSGTGPPCSPSYEGTDPNSVAHYLPGTNPLTDELYKTHGVPKEAARGGAETMYPEYRKKLKDAYVRPEKCLSDCGLAERLRELGGPRAFEDH